MKKTLVLLFFLAAWLLSGCVLAQPSLTEAPVVTLPSEQAVSDSTTTRPETIRTTTTTSHTTTATTTIWPDPTREPTPTSAPPTHAPAETTRPTAQTPTTTKAKPTPEPTPTISPTLPAPTEATSQATETAAPDTTYGYTLKRDVLVLMLAYPGYVTGVERVDQVAFLVMKSGARILYDDRKKKSFDDKVSDADLQDMLEMPYPLHDIDELMGPDDDPGRIRVYALLDEVYGVSKEAILKKLVTVDFGDEHLPFNKEAGAAAALKAIAAGTADLVAKQPQVEDFLFSTSGTFNYRVIAGTDRLSPHAYGIAIDLKSGADGYWRWATSEAGEQLIQIYPKDLVRLFEKHGFIWGGKWNHFDIFHFEYQPEILLKASFFAGSPDLSQPWYQGVNADSEPASGYIAQIDQSLGP